MSAPAAETSHAGVQVQDGTDSSPVGVFLDEALEVRADFARFTPHQRERVIQAAAGRDGEQGVHGDLLAVLVREAGAASWPVEDREALAAVEPSGDGHRLFVASDFPALVEGDSASGSEDGLGEDLAASLPDRFPSFVDAALEPVREESAAPLVGGSGTVDGCHGFVPLSQVIEREVEWLWNLRIARANVAVLAGDGGIGKSTLAQEIAARITRGEPLPGGTAERPRGVLVLTAEEDAAAVVRPRMRLMGANLERVLILDPDRAQMTFPSGAEALEVVSRQVDAGLVVIDTGPAFMDHGLSSNAEEDVRRFLGPLKQLAERLRLVVIVLCHLNKAAGADARRRVMGGAAWVNAPRQVLIVGTPRGEDPRESGSRLVAVEKSNLGSYPPAVAFDLVPAPSDAARGVVRWGDEVEGITASDIVPTGQRDGRDDQDGDDREVLLDILADGPLSAVDFQKEARNADISRHTFERVRAALKSDGLIERYQEPRVSGRGASRWLWKLADSFTPPEPFTPPVSGEVGGVKHPRNDGGLSDSLFHSPLPQMRVE